MYFEQWGVNYAYKLHHKSLVLIIVGYHTVAAHVLRTHKYFYFLSKLKVILLLETLRSSKKTQGVLVCLS